jgi:hypothetical protein
MEIVNFFEKLAGRWFSQRTTHDLTGQQSQAGQSNLEVEFMPASAAAVQALCRELAADPSHALCGLQVNQSSTIEGDPKQWVSSTLVVPLSPEAGANGRLLRKMTSPGSQPSISQYSLENEILMIYNEDDTIRAEERWWFITENLRMRTSLLNGQNGVRLASFCSEIRLGGSRPASP